MCPICKNGFYLVFPNHSVRWLEKKLFEEPSQTSQPALPALPALPKNNFMADRPPRASDNVLIGYRKGSFWLYNGEFFVCEKEGVESTWIAASSQPPPQPSPQPPPQAHLNIARLNVMCNARKRTCEVIDLSDSDSRDNKKKPALYRREAFEATKS
jgi:hypothetical protein